MLNRLTLLLSLLGMVLALHLWVQKERHFDQGCWGVGPSGGTAQAAGCTSPELAKASELAGVSVATWGYAFYFFVSVMAFAKILLPTPAARRCHAFSEVAVALAFPFSCYLLFIQAFLAKTYCPLCVVSGGFVTALFVIHAIQYWRGGFEPLPDSARSTEFGYATALAFVAMGLLAALMIIVNHVGTRRLDQGENATQFVTLVGNALPRYIEAERLLEMKPALLDRAVPPLKQQEWLAEDIPFLGTKGGVNVVAFLDPNCPGCTEEYDRLNLLAAQYHDRAAFYVFSRALWDYSLLQTQALELARRENRYFEMWQVQFARRQPDGLRLPEIEKIFAELGLDRSDLENRLAAVRSSVIASREKAMAAGINSTPTIFIDGQAVDNQSRDLRSLRKLVERALASGR